MRIASAVLAAATLALSAAAANAAPVHVDDTQFLAANRCLGLMTSHTLGSPDATALRQFIHDQSWGRVAFVYDKADELRDTAMHTADRADTDLRARLTAERDGVCHSFVNMTTAGGRGTNSSIQ